MKKIVTVLLMALVTVSWMFAQDSSDDATLQAQEAQKVVLEDKSYFDFNLSNTNRNPFKMNMSVEMSLVGIRGDKNKIGKVIIPSTANMGESVVIIEDLVFEDCTALESVELPKDVFAIGKSCFLNCTSLKEIIFPKHMKSIDFDDEALKDCVALEELTFPKETKSISFSKAVFSGCTSLKTITFPEGKVKVKFAKDTFLGCTNLSDETKAKLKALKYKGTF